MKWPDLRRLDGYLPEDMEKSYRLHYLKDDTRTASFSMWLLCILLVAFAYNDYLLFGFTPVFYFLVSLRGAYFVYFTVLIIYLGKNRDPRKYDISMFVWLLLSMAMVIIVNQTRPPSYAGNFPIDIVLILLIYLCMPMRLLFRFLGTLIFTLSEILTLFFIRQIASPTIAFSSLFALLAANAGGILASHVLYSTRRSGYQARVEEARVASEWQTTFDSMSEPISLHSGDYRLIRINSAYADIFKARPEELIGRRCYEVVHGTSAPLPDCPHTKTMKSWKPVLEEIYEPRLCAHLEVSTSPIFNENGNVRGTVHIVKDISERRQLLQKLEEMSTHDFLTGLPNRVLVRDRFDVAAAQAKRKGSKLALMSLDLDNFKLVNDTLRHAAGDSLLIVAAARLSSAMRASDTVARIGGDEFVLLLQEVDDREDAVKIAEKIINAFREPFTIEGHSLNVTTSIGIALYPESGDDLATLTRASDKALYNAKRLGRNNYQVAA